MGKHTIDDLRMMQGLPLSVKVRMTETRIRQWVDYYGEDGVYVSFSGGKDSTVLLDIVRGLYPDIKAMFVNTGLEYPEIQAFVKTFDNVDILRPKMRFDEVIRRFGYPFISKDTSKKIYEARRGGEKVVAYRKLLGLEEFAGSLYSAPKYEPLIYSDFVVSDRCCNVMKKGPAHKYNKDTKRVPITGQQASESRLRTEKWLENGCNAFDQGNPISNPMSFWTE